MKKFEYKSFLVLNDTNSQPIAIEYKGERLNYDQFYHPLLMILGNEGWELITVNTKVASNEISYGETTYALTYTQEELYQFKRELTKHIDFTKTDYKDMYNYLDQLDKKFERRNEFSLEKEEDLSQEDLISKYVDAGYTVIFNHKNRVELERNFTKIRFDFNGESGTWIKSTINYD